VERVKGVVGEVARAVSGVWQAGKRVVVVVVTGTVLGISSVWASTDPMDIITAASDKYDAAVAIFIAAAVIGAGIYFIRKGLRGRM
jgi:hypothetical protein